MADLEFLLRKAVKHGLNYLSLSPNHSNPKEGPWVGCYRTVEDANCQYVNADDPVEAIEKAIRTGEAYAKRRRQHREEVEIPLQKTIDRVQRRNLASVAARKEEEASKKAAIKRRREEDDLA
jgi:hypothetical protein